MSATWPASALVLQAGNIWTELQRDDGDRDPATGCWGSLCRLDPPATTVGSGDPGLRLARRLRGDAGTAGRCGARRARPFGDTRAAGGGAPCAAPRSADAGAIPAL